MKIVVVVLVVSSGIFGVDTSVMRYSSEMLFLLDVDGTEPLGLKRTEYSARRTTINSSSTSSSTNGNGRTVLCLRVLRQCFWASLARFAVPRRLLLRAVLSGHFRGICCLLLLLLLLRRRNFGEGEEAQSEAKYRMCRKELWWQTDRQWWRKHNWKGRITRTNN